MNQIIIPTQSQIPFTTTVITPPSNTKIIASNLYTTHLFTNSSKWNDIDPLLLDCYTKLYEYRVDQLRREGECLEFVRFTSDSKRLYETLSQFSTILYDTPQYSDLREGLKTLHLHLHQMSSNLRSASQASKTELLVLLADFQGENKEFTDSIDIARQRISSNLKRTSFTFSEGTTLNRFNILSIIALASASVVLAAFTKWSVIEGIGVYFLK